MRTWILAVCVVAACGGGPEDETKARSQQCAKLRDHLVELRVGAARGTASELAQHRVAMKQALGAQFVETCITTTTDVQATCALAARDSQSAAECLAVEGGN